MSEVRLAREEEAAGLVDLFRQRRVDLKLDHGGTSNGRALARRAPIEYHNLVPGLNQRQRCQSAADAAANDGNLAGF